MKLDLDRIPSFEVRVVNRIKECERGFLHPRRNTDGIELAVIHRFGPSIRWGKVDRPITSAADVATFFATHKDGLKTTRGKMGYTTVQLGDRIEQALPMNVMAQHARNYNRSGLGHAVIGDWTKAAAPATTLYALADFLLVLVRAKCLRIIGHTEIDANGDGVPDATSDPTKVCPGPGLVLGEVRAYVARWRETPLDIPTPSEIGLVW